MQGGHSTFKIYQRRTNSVGMTGGAVAPIFLSRKGGGAEKKLNEKNYTDGQCPLALEATLQYNGANVRAS